MAIEMIQIRKSFGEPPTDVLKGINACIENGEMISIAGRSGSGKSTLLYIMSSLDKPTSGDVLVDGISLASLDSRSLHHFRNQKMGFVFQFHHLLPELTALENVLMPTLKSIKKINSRNFALELLKEFGLEDKQDRFPRHLSGGEQQRVAIARALVMNPSIVFADEPTGNLDSVNGQLVMSLFQRINKQRGTTIIYVTHDHLFAQMASRQINLVDGRVVEALGI